MIFSFYKYLQPITYFNLKSDKDFGYFPTIQQLDAVSFPYVIDTNYKSSISQERDVAWTAFQQGFISKDYAAGLDIWKKEAIPLQDEYVFLFKNFHKPWVYYVLLIRMLTLHNPFSELVSFLKAKKIKRFNFAENHFNYRDYEIFDSKLIKENPLVSVIIPTLNRYVYLKDVLRDLEKQTYKNFEVIIVDQTDDFQESFYKGWNLDLHFWFQEEKALWRARNEAIQFSKGKYILLYDDDSLVEPNWIEEHIKTLDFFDADLSSGVSISAIGDEIPKHYSYFRWSDQVDTGNVLLKREIFEQIGLFDRQFEKQRMGDGEFGLRAYLAGYKNISNYRAKRIHLKVSQGGLRQMGSWDGWRPKKLFGPRPVPSVLYLARKYFGVNLTKYYILHAILPSLVPYQFKKSKFLKVLSFVTLPFVLPLVCFQVVKSWQLASEKIKEGDKIKKLKS
jgi:glycosyltransferase involved in cell wall biosynthesis